MRNPGFDFEMDPWELHRWQSATPEEWLAWTAFAAALWAAADSHLGVCVTQHADAESNAIMAAERMASDKHELRALGWAAPRVIGLRPAPGAKHKLNENKDFGVEIDDSDFDLGADAKDEVDFGMKVNGALSTAGLRVRQHSRACQAAGHEAQWLVSHADYFRSGLDLQIAEARRQECRKGGRTKEDGHANAMQFVFDKTHGRLQPNMSPFADRCWQVFETGEMPPKYWNPKTKQMEEHDPHESQSPGRQYERSWWWTGTNTEPVLPKKCFVEYINWPDCCVFGDIKDGVRTWLRDLLENPAVVTKTAVFVGGLKLNAHEDGARVRIPRKTWRMIISEAYPELAGIHARCVAWTIKNTSDINGRWARVWQYAMKMLSPESQEKLRRYHKVVSNPPEVIWGQSETPVDEKKRQIVMPLTCSKPLTKLARLAQGWRGFYTRLEGLSSQLSGDQDGFDSRSFAESKEDHDRGVCGSPGQGEAQTGCSVAQASA